MTNRTNLLLPDLERWPADRPVIELVNVSKSFGGEKVIDGLSLRIQTGQTTVIAGQSGSGKSVLLRMMNGLTLPDEGQVFLFGEDLAQCGEARRTELRKRCTMVFQNYALIDSLTVRENIAFPLAENTDMSRQAIDTLVIDLLRLLELEHAIDQLPSSLSGGMKKRVSLARAVITNPEVVLFDEPTTGLDPIMIEFVDELIMRTQKEYEITSVIISHDMASNRRLADQMAMLVDGRIAVCGSFEEVIASQEPKVQVFMADARMGRLSESNAETSVEPSADPVGIAVARVADLHKSFGENHVLKGIDLAIPENQITVVIGGSGSGKSVLIKHMIGLMRPSRGSVEVFGQDLLALDAKGLAQVQSRIGMLFQGAALFDSMTVADNIAFPLVEGRRQRGKEVHERVEQMAEELHVADILDRLPSGISNGEKKRVALARAMITRPEILIYDEPTTGQDPVMMRRVDDMVVEASERFDITSIVISHDMDSTFRIADQVALIYEGELLASGPPQVVRDSEDERVRRFIYAGS